MMDGFPSVLRERHLGETMVSIFKNKALLLVSGFIILSDLLFIAINYYSVLNTVEADTRRWAREVQHVFSLTLETKSTSMQQLASFVANMPRVQELLWQARTIYEQPPSEKKDAALSRVRSQLHEYVKPSWKTMTSQYDVRQLHFHFGPGSTSFLRVHRPERFGDNMDEVRYTVVDVNQLHKPVKGFETGRVYSGIRGVVPVSVSPPDGGTVHIGALESGTSFTVMLKVLADELDSNVAVLLTQDHVNRNMWPEFIRDHFPEARHAGRYFIECSTASRPRAFFSREDVARLLDQGLGSRFIIGDNSIQVGVFPLRDYRGTTDFSLPDAGAVVVWKDASEVWTLVRRTLQNNILYSLVALIIIEIALVIGWRLSQRHLRRIIRRQTRKLRNMATRDALTGLYNRRAIERHLTEETNRTQRHPSPFSVIMFDIDHFKKVNDTYGHNVGDEVLRKVGKRVAGLVRNTDRLGRWGGEEFLVLCPETTVADAVILADRIRKGVEEMRFAKAAPVTVSLGVSQFLSPESYESLVQRADSALYEAKKTGRNKVCRSG